MIKAMSSNHTFAQKAYSFLQQLLGCMDKSLPTTTMRWDGATDTCAPTTQSAIYDSRKGIDGIGLARNLDETGRMIPDEELFAGLSDFTQDLNEMYADLGSEMSAWFDEQGPAVYRTVE
jgi:hypothetical protein